MGLINEISSLMFKTKFCLIRVFPLFHTLYHIVLVVSYFLFHNRRVRNVDETRYLHLFRDTTQYKLQF